MALPQPSRDDRQAERRIVRVRAAVTVAGSDAVYAVRTENASSEGLAIRMPHALPARTKLDVHFAVFAGQRQVAITASGVVVHTLLSGDSWLTGLSITSIPDDQRRFLAEYCAGRR